MGLKRSPTFGLFIWIGILVISCNTQKSKSEIEIEFKRDTLKIGYTYWWPQSGPFIGNCGEELSMVFTGTLTDLNKPTDDPGPLYVSQEGTIELQNVFKIKDLQGKPYANQQFIVTDCFYESGLKAGDKVLVCLYDYEGAYSIPGGKSILKLNSFDDPLINSIKKYIDSEQDPLKLKDDIALWEKYGLDKDLQQLIECKQETKTIGSQAEVQEQENY